MNAMSGDLRDVAISPLSTIIIPKNSAGIRSQCRAIYAFLEESGDLLRQIREDADASKRYRAVRRLHWMALVVGAPGVNRALRELNGVGIAMVDAVEMNEGPTGEGLLLASEDALSERHLDHLARLHAAAAEARAAAASIVASQGSPRAGEGL